MPRRFLKKFLPAPQALRERWAVRLFGDRMADPQLWTLHRRGVTYAFGAGIAICFVPLPVHLLLCVCVALLWRLNLPVMYGATWIFTNPFTAVPVYYMAYRVGAALMHLPRQHFRFVADAALVPSRPRAGMAALRPRLLHLRGGGRTARLAAARGRVALAGGGPLPRAPQRAVGLRAGAHQRASSSPRSSS